MQVSVLELGLPGLVHEIRRLERYLLLGSYSINYPIEERI